MPLPYFLIISMLDSNMAFQAIFYDFLSKFYICTFCR